MKQVILITLLSLLPFAAAGHPGKTDHYGGHLCLKECEEWNLFYKEYHLHDKDGHAVRIKKARTRKTAESPSGEAPTLPAGTVVQPDHPKSSVVATPQYAAVVSQERSLTSNPLLFILLTLFLLLLALRLKRRRGEY